MKGPRDSPSRAIFESMPIVAPFSLLLLRVRHGSHVQPLIVTTALVGWRESKYFWWWRTEEGLITEYPADRVKTRGF